MDNRGLGVEATRIESLDAQDKRTGVKIFGIDKEAWTSGSINFGSSPRVGRALGEVSSRVWIKPGLVGRPYLSRLSETPFWDNVESSSSAVIDLSIRVST